MKITFVGHASILIEAGGITILSDPWWRGPCFGAQWWIYPSPDLSFIGKKKIDYIYISHGHHDHFHLGTLNTLNSDAKVLVSRNTKLAPFIQEAGFEVVELDEGDQYPLGTQGVTCQIIPTYADDTLAVVRDNNEVCVNLNDALHSAPESIKATFVARLRSLYPHINYVFCGYGTASHFPNCYVIPGKNRNATAARRQGYFNRQWADLIAKLQPDFGFPFAADVVFLEKDLFWVNEPVHNSERPTSAFNARYPSSKVKTRDIAPGFVIENGTILKEILRTPFVGEDYLKNFPEQVARANRYGNSPTMESVQEVAALVRDAVKLSEDYLASHDSDYRFLIRFRNSHFGIQIEKHASELNVKVCETETQDIHRYDLIYTTRLNYLKRSLTEPYGSEILFVGSGGIFEYTNGARAKQNLHLELQTVLRKRERAPGPRYGNSSRRIFMIKRRIKQMTFKSRDDLYDLAVWTVMM